MSKIKTTTVALKESPDTVHGRLLESVHVSGYSFERACSKLEWLLDENRWMRCGNGFSNIRDFLDTVDLSPFKIESSHRKRLAKRLADLEASQRATAKLLGVDEGTIRGDLGRKGAENSAPPTKTANENSGVNGNDAENSALPQIGGRDAARMIEKKQDEAAKQQAKQQKKSDKKNREASARKTKPRIFHCAVTELSKHVKSGSVHAVITDPPYSKEFLTVYSDLSECCQKILRPGGLLVCMVGQSYMPDVIANLSKHLQYRWSCAYLTPGGQSVQLWTRQVNTFWKPLLVFSNGKFDLRRWIGDVFKSDVNDNDKEHHHWGQSESGMARVIEAFTEPGEVVCDPFLGGGTTAVVSCEMGRRFVGCDIDESCIGHTMGRINV